MFNKIIQDKMFWTDVVFILGSTTNILQSLYVNSVLRRHACDRSLKSGALGGQNTVITSYDFVKDWSYFRLKFVGSLVFPESC